MLNLIMFFKFKSGSNKNKIDEKKIDTINFCC